MSELWVFLQIGFRHIVALDAADHIFFLLALAAIYRGRNWRSALWVITAFSVGHTISLGLAVANLLPIPAKIIEFLIPVTIVLTGVENIALRERAASGRGARHRPLLSGIFGLVHGAGFAGYLKSLFVSRIAVPLFAFNVGIEIGQVVVVVAAVGLFWLVDRILSSVVKAKSKPGSHDARAYAFQLRLIGVSAVVTIIASGWAWARWPA
jgi:hypothetical protein